MGSRTSSPQSDNQMPLNSESDITIDFKEIDKQYKSSIIIPNIKKNDKLIFKQSNTNLNQLACYLFQTNQQFVDKIVPNSNLMPQNLCKWRRAQEVFPGEKYRNPDWSFQFQSENKNRYSNNQIKLAFKWLQNQGKELLQNICLSKELEIFKPGLYRFIFCLNGKKNKEVVIDSFIPIDNFGRYLWDEPKKGGGIWMVLLVKALAKVVGSYKNLSVLSKKQILSEITGYPNYEDFEKLKQKSTYPLSIKGREQKYFKIGNSQKIIFNLYFWFNLKTDEINKCTERDNSNDYLIVQIFQRKEQLLRSMGLSCQKKPTTKFKDSGHSNILKIKAINTQNTQNRQTIITQEKGAFIYLFNLSHSDISCNLVTQSDKNLLLHESRTDQDMRECRLTKIQALKFHYSQIHNNLETFQFSQYKLRCSWDKNRGIFCLKNTKKSKKTFRFIIKQQFRDNVFFEQKKNEYFLQEEVQPDMHSIFIVTRVKIQQCGPFYSIQCIQK